MRLKKALLLVFCILAGAVAGALVAGWCAGVPGLSWLAFSRSVGISPQAPLLVDLSVLQFSIALKLEFSIAQVIFVVLGIVAYNVLTRKR